MNDPDHLLRDAGARLRDTAPSAEATEAALDALDDVRLEAERPDRRRLGVIATALTAAAAVALGVLVLTRPSQEAITPTESTEVPAPTTTPVPTPTTTPVTVPAPVVPPASTLGPSTIAPTTTPATVPGEVELAQGIRMRTTDADFDGNGGACLTVVTATEEVRGCAGGATMRGAYGEPLHFRLDGEPTALFPNGGDGSGRPELVIGSTTVTPCFLATDLPGQMVDVASCTDDGVGVVGALPATADGVTTWTLIGTEQAPDGVSLEVLYDVNESTGGRVFRSPETDLMPSCLIVAARDDVVREACGLSGTHSVLAGSADAPLVVDHDTEQTTTLLTALDPDTTLAASGCPDLTVGALVALLPTHGTVSSLLCGGDAGVAWLPMAYLHGGPIDGSIFILGRDGAGGYTVSGSGTGYDCESIDVCGELGVADLADALPFPSPATVAAFDEALGGASTLTSRLATDAFTALQTTRGWIEMGEALVADLRAGADPDQRIDVVGSSSPIVIRQTNLDDSVTATIYVVATSTLPSGETAVVANHVRAFDVCARGVTMLDGAPVCV